MRILKKILKPRALLIFILLLTVLLRLYRLDYPPTYVFDEVYHAFTAKEMAHGSVKAWEWWHTPPEGVAYEWTHPPLAKEIMAFSLLIFRTEDPWAWRLPGVFLGSLSVYLVYAIGRRLFQNRSVALLSTFIFSLDGLNFVQSRTGMNDIYFITFMLASLFFFVDKKFLLSAIFLGLSLASKWTAIYTLLIYIPFLIKERKTFYLSYYLVTLPLVYLLSYLPFFILGHNFRQFLDLQLQMWWYHTGLKATHSYSSPWWSWPLNLYPVWYFVDYQGQKIANIFASGNPIIFWGGLVALVLTLVEVIKKKTTNLIIILVGFFAFWLPWSLSPRIMFLYHFSPSVPFLTLALGYQLNKALADKNYRKLALILLIGITFVFILLYPFLTATLLPRGSIQLFFTTNLSKNPF